MGVGQHYNMAAWVGENFGEMSNNKNLTTENRQKKRNYVLKCIKIDDI